MTNVTLAASFFLGGVAFLGVLYLFLVSNVQFLTAFVRNSAYGLSGGAMFGLVTESLSLFGATAAFASGVSLLVMAWHMG